MTQQYPHPRRDTQVPHVASADTSSAGLARPHLPVKGHGWSVAWLGATRSHAPSCASAYFALPRRTLTGPWTASLSRACSAPDTRQGHTPPPDNRPNTTERTHP